MNATIYVGPDADLWEAYKAACKAKGKTASEALREHMERVVRKAGG